MASRKLTQLPNATEVTSSDKIYIVDVSDTSESPQGTSKQAVISNLPSSGITTLTSTDGSIDIDLTDPSAPDLSIGFTQTVLDLTFEETSSLIGSKINKIGGTLSFTNDASYSFTLNRTGGDPLTGVLIGSFLNGLSDTANVVPIIYQANNGNIDIDASFTFKNIDGSAIDPGATIRGTLVLTYYPNGWDA